MENLKTGSDVLFVLLGAILVLAMHAGFAFLELGTVRRKSQVNALVKILCDFAVSTIAYFFIGYTLAYGVNFLGSAEQLVEKSGYELVKFFFLLTVAAAVPAAGGDVSAGGFCLPVFRRHRVERQVRRAGLAGGERRRQVS